MSVELGYYRHYKGNIYQVVGVGKFSEKLDGVDGLLDVVIYRALYESEYGYGAFWIRPMALFTSTVTVNGNKVPRFARLTEEEANIQVAKKV